MFLHWKMLVNSVYVLGHLQVVILMVKTLIDLLYKDTPHILSVRFASVIRAGQY